MEEKLDDTVRGEIMKLHEKRIKQKELEKRTRRSTTESENNGSSGASSGSSSESESDGEKSEAEKRGSDMEMESDFHENNGESEDDMESRSPAKFIAPSLGPISFAGKLMEYSAKNIKIASNYLVSFDYLMPYGKGHFRLNHF